MVIFLASLSLVKKEGRCPSHTVVMKTTLNVVKEIKDLKQCQAVTVAAFSWAVGFAGVLAVGFAGVLAVWCSRCPGCLVFQVVEGARTAAGGAWLWLGSASC